MAYRIFGWTLGAMLFAALLAAPRAGWASCGDYLLHHVHHAEQTGLGAFPHDGDDRLAPAPCRGPHCSQRVPAPAIPAAPSLAPVGPRDPMCWWAVVPSHESTVRWHGGDVQNEMASLIIAARLFRPPRAS